MLNVLLFSTQRICSVIWFGWGWLSIFFAWVHFDNLHIYGIVDKEITCNYQSLFNDDIYICSIKHEMRQIDKCSDFTVLYKLKCIVYTL